MYVKAQPRMDSKEQVSRGVSKEEVLGTGPELMEGSHSAALSGNAPARDPEYFAL